MAISSWTVWPSVSYEAYRVRKKFGWRGWTFTPQGPCACGCGAECKGQAATGCHCPDKDYCVCGIDPLVYGGDIWLVEQAHPRKDIMLGGRFAVGDASIPPVEELLKDPQYARLLALPGAEVIAKVTETRELVGAGRGPGRPRRVIPV